MQRYNRQNLVVACFFFGMIIVNTLANTIPINGVTTGQVSDDLLNLFVPAPITFSIWGLIYFLLLGYVIYSFVIHEDDLMNKQKELSQLAFHFCLSSLFNAGWILVWHYKLILLSTLVIVLLLISLIFARFSIERMPLRGREMLLIRLPFSIYLGWLTVATIASVTSSLVHVGWNGWGIAPEIWTGLVLVAGVLIGGVSMLSLSDGAYGLVLIWAYAGILLKHLSSAGFDGAYPGIISTVIICLLSFVVLEIYLARKKMRQTETDNDAD